MFIELEQELCWLTPNQCCQPSRNSRESHGFYNLCFLNSRLQGHSQNLTEFHKIKKYYFHWFLLILLGSLFRENSGSDYSGLHGLNTKICSRCSLSPLFNVTWFVIRRIIGGSLRKSNHNWRYTNPNGTFEQTPRVYSSVYLWLCSFASILDDQKIENGKVKAKGWFGWSWCTK